MQNELQTALFQAFDTLNLQRVKTFSVPPVTLCGPGAVSSLRAASANAWAETSVRDGRQLFASGGDDRRADAQPGC
ncbi:alcohol dehydrogenase in ethanolamine utilization [Escherichia coli]|nr:alcohol dehydrogenase in ethanolamine utilization [Escherichia coli]